MRLLRFLVAALFAFPFAAPHASGSTQASGAWVFTGRVHDGGTGPAREAEVVVQGERIRCVAAPGGCDLPAGARRIVAPDATLIPGLIDLHVHAREGYAEVFIKGGVTSVRDANNSFATIEGIRRMPGAPRVFASGPLLDGPGSVLAGMSEKEGAPGAFPIAEQELLLVATPEDAVRAVDLLADAGAQHVKLYELMPPAAFAAAVGRARERGLPVMVDLGLAVTRGLDGAEVDALQAAQAGVASIEHASGVALAYRRLGGDPEAQELDAALLEHIAGVLVEADVAVVPSLVGIRAMASEAYPAAADYPLVAELDPGLTGWWQASHAAAEGKRERFAQVLHLHGAFLRAFIARGGRVGVGTDVPALPMLVPGDALRHEIALLAGHGLSPAEALHAATGGAARILGSTEVGRVEAGRYADLVLVQGDPSRVPMAAGAVLAVWKGGTLVHGAPPTAVEAP